METVNVTIVEAQSDAGAKDSSHNQYIWSESNENLNKRKQKENNDNSNTK